MHNCFLLPPVYPQLMNEREKGAGESRHRSSGGRRRRRRRRRRKRRRRRNGGCWHDVSDTKEADQAISKGLCSILSS